MNEKERKRLQKNNERKNQFFIYSVGTTILIAIPMFIIGVSIESAITGIHYDLFNWGDSLFGSLIGGIAVGIIFVSSLIYFGWKLWYVNPKKEREKTLKEEEQHRRQKEREIFRKIKERETTLREEERHRSEKEREMLEKIKEIMKVSTRIKFNMLRNILDTDKKTFDNKIFEWAKEFNFIIDGDSLVINKDTVSDFIDALDREFVLWRENKKR